MRRHIWAILSCTLALSPLAQADVDDVAGSRDHPMFSRLPGYYIQDYEERDFDTLDYIGKDQQIMQVEGRKYHISHCIKGDAKPMSEVQILRNFTNAAKKIGGSADFQSATDAYLTISKDNAVTWTRVHVWNQGDCYDLFIVQKEAMAQDVVADAKQLANDITTTGKAAIYGIYFDTDKADVKPQSEPALQQIAKLLRDNPGLKLHVVGHTDSTGDLTHNMKLSEARAQAVVRELTGKYGISASRLRPDGVGPLVPMASNRADAGRAKNRRVELVEQ